MQQAGVHSRLLSQRFRGQLSTFNETADCPVSWTTLWSMDCLLTDSRGKAADRSVSGQEQNKDRSIKVSRGTR